MKNPLLSKPWESDGQGMYIMCDGHTVCEIRGWGYLTGLGGLRLKEKEAVKIQKEIQAVIVEAVNSKIKEFSKESVR